MQIAQVINFNGFQVVVSTTEKPKIGDWVIRNNHVTIMEKRPLPGYRKVLLTPCQIKEPIQSKLVFWDGEKIINKCPKEVINHVLNLKQPQKNKLWDAYKYYCSFY